jgi:hypothetical protein
MIFQQKAAPRVGLEAALSVAGPAIRQALMESHRMLTELRVRHMLIGGLALAAARGGAHAAPPTSTGS